MKTLKLALILIAGIWLASCSNVNPTSPTPEPGNWIIGEIQIESFTASKSVVQKGEMIALTWKVKNAFDVRIDPIGKDLPPIGSYFVTPGMLTTYTLTAWSGEVKKSASVTIEVDGWWETE